MLCDKCGKNEANVKLVTIINGQQSTMHLCEDCARAQNELSLSSLNLSLPDLLSDFLKANTISSAYHAFSTKEHQCPKCNLTWSDFQSRSRLGCNQCYETFRPQLLPLIRRIHGQLEHRGRGPQTHKAQLQKKQSLKKLKLQLQEAIVEERFEDAAMLRDEIKKLDTNAEGGE